LILPGRSAYPESVPGKASTIDLRTIQLNVEVFYSVQRGSAYPEVVSGQVGAEEAGVARVVAARREGRRDLNECLGFGLY
jgi:hypothetical protein